MAADLAELAYEASLRRLDKQEQLLEELRARTGLLLAAASLAASFLGRPALDADPVLLAGLALLAFAVSMGASLYVLLPKKNLVFAVIGSRLYEEYCCSPPLAVSLGSDGELAQATFCSPAYARDRLARDAWWRKPQARLIARRL